jgi:Na+/H+ antiporter NhaC
LFWLAAAGVIAGALPVILFLLFTGSFFSIIWQGLYLFTATPTVYARISGFQFSR